MDLPLRLLNGELLYRDIHYLYAPFSPYLNALLYWLFGVHLDVLQASGILGAVIIVWLSFRIARRLLEPLDAMLGVLCIVVWLVFRPQGNLISPYAYAALHATIFALGALLCSLRFNELGRSRDLLMAGALIGFAAITKLEFAVPAAAAMAASLLLTVGLRQGARRAVVAAAPIVLITASVYGWFLHRVGWETLVVDCHLFYTHLPRSLIVYNAWRAGTNRPLASLAEMAGGVAVCAVIVSSVLIAALVVAARGEGAAKSRSRQLLWRCLIVLVVAASIAFGVARATGGWDGSPLRAAPILLIGVVIHAWPRNRLAGQREGLLIISIYSLVMLLRVALRVPSGGPYGAFLVPTTYVVIVYLLVRGLPEAIRRWRHSDALATTARQAVRVLLVCALATGAGIAIARYQTRYRFRVSAPRGELRVVETHHPALQEALNYLGDHSSPEDRIAIFPEGSDIAFLGERRMPLRHQILLPGLMSSADERRMIGQLSSEPVRFVFVVNRATGEFGAEVFGRDFYQELGSAIEREYRLVKVCGRNRNPKIEIGDPEFFIKVLERK